MTRAMAIGTIVGLAVAAVAVAALLPPIPQDPAYHRLADARGWLGVPNAANVPSNAGFLRVGALGLRFLARPDADGGHFREPAERWPYAVFGGLLLTGLGSAYYDWAPGNPRLAWDRLPLAITIMGVLDAVVAERLGASITLRLLAPLVAIAAGSVGYWAWTEQHGAGDLRAYTLKHLLAALAGYAVLLMLERRRAVVTRTP